MRRGRLFHRTRKLARRFGFDVVRTHFPPDFDAEDREIVASAEPFTMTNRVSVYALVRATRYVVEAGVAGDIVECGVWKGGSMMAVASTLQHMGRSDRDIYLFDTFQGMPAPGESDVDIAGVIATEKFARLKTGDDRSSWAAVPMEEVRANLATTGFPEERLHFIKGKVEDTVPDSAPAAIAILRLDTDWYGSTIHELEHLYPRLSSGGVLILDDYGNWKGHRQAADEFFAANGVHLLLNRMDYAGRIAVKP